MGFGHLDSAIRVGGITMLLLLAWLLFQQRRKVGVPASLFPPLAICLTGFIIGNTPEASLRLSGAPGVIAHFASGWAVVFLWWFCLACFDKGFRPRGAILAAGLAWLVLAAAARSIEDPVPGLSYTLVGLGFCIVIHLIWALYREREGDLIQKRYDARGIVAVVLGSLLLIDLSVDLLFGFSWRPAAFAIAQNTAVLGFSLWLARQVFAVRSGVLSFDGQAVAAAVARPAEEAAVDGSLRQRLRALIDVERVHLDPDLTFASFVGRMNAPERAVRDLVNRALGFDHFRSFLNHYRVREACALLADPARAGDKLIVIALDSGFASLPSFNRVFRAERACTPSQFREAALAQRALRPEGQASAQIGPEPGFEKRSAAF
jgi:AraC-like DNA-binding protein